MQLLACFSEFKKARQNIFCKGRACLVHFTLYKKYWRASIQKEKQLYSSQKIKKIS